MKIELSNLLTRRTDKKQIITNIRSLVPLACRIGIGNKHKHFLKYLAQLLEVEDTKLINTLCYIADSIGNGKKFVVACNCGCHNQHAEALISFFGEYKDAIEIYYKSHPNYSHKLNDEGLTLENSGLPDDVVEEVKEAIKSNNAVEA